MNQPAPQKTIDNWRALVERLQTEADLCRNEGAEDIAALLDEAVIGLQGMAAEGRALRDERDAAVRGSLMAGDCLHRIILAMRAAVVDGHLQSPEHGLQWIVNTLDGPGNLPDLEEAVAIGGAQALFDKEIAEHDAFRKEHPAPAIDAARGKGEA